MSLPLTVLVTALLLLGNAYFVGSEFAVMSARRSRIEPLVEQGHRRAGTVLYALENVTLMLATCQLGVTLFSIALGAVSEPAIAAALEHPLHSLGLNPVLTHPIAFVISLALVVFLHVLLGEMVPKNLSVTKPETLALVLVPTLVSLSKVMYPVVAFLNWFSNQFVRLFGVQPKSEVASAFTADEVASIVEVSEAAGVLDVDTDLISGALEFSEHTAGEVMVPLAKVSSVSAHTTVEEFEQAVGNTGFSRLPVLDDHGVMVGYLHIKDLLDTPVALRGKPIASEKIRSFPHVDAGDEVEHALCVMQKAGAHMAQVTDKGAVVGVLFLEDILEELVGEVRDEMQR